MREGIETLRTMFIMPHECIMFYCLDFYCCFSCISRQTVILINYRFLSFTSWLVYAKYLSGSTVQHAGNK